MADRVGVITKGELILAEEKTTLMRKLGKRQLTLTLQHAMTEIPSDLAAWSLEIKDGGMQLEYSFDAQDDRSDIPGLLQKLSSLGIGFKDLNTRKSSLEEIFVNLVSERSGAGA